MSKEVPQVRAERGGVLRGPVRVDADQVERRPVDALPGAGGVGHPSAEAVADGRRGLGEKGVDVVEYRAEGHPPVQVRGDHGRQPVQVGVAGEEAVAEGADLAAGDEHHVRADLAHRLGALRAVGEKRQRLHRVQVYGERGEPHLQPGVRRVPGRDGQPFRFAAGDAHGVAVQVFGDDRHLPPDGLGVEGLPGQAVSGNVPVS